MLSAWVLLVLSVAAAAILLLRPVRPALFSFRGSTLLGFLALSVGMTAPIALHPTRMMLASGGGEDAFIGIWNLWWTRMSVQGGLNPLETRWLFHPHGTNLALHTYSLSYGLLTLPLQWILRPSSEPGGSAAPLFIVYNLIILSSFTLTAYFTYRLALQQSGHRAASILSGVIFAFMNFRFANTVRLHVLATEFLVLSAWACTSWLAKPGAARLAFWVGSYVLLVYTSLEYAAYAVLLFLVLAVPTLMMAARERKKAVPARPSVERRPPGLLFAVILAAGALLALPLGIQLIRRWQEGTTAFDPRLASFFSADLLDFFLPNPRHPLWGRLSASATARFHMGNGGFGLSLGWVALALFVVASRALFRGTRGRVWFWGFIFFWILTLGPSLKVGGGETGVPMPQALVSRVLPFLAGSRTPIRYVAPAGLCLAVAIAVGLAAAHRTRRNEEGSSLRPSKGELALGLLLVVDLLAAPMPIAAVPVPEVYRHLDAPPGSAAVVHVPDLPARQEMLFQTVHEQLLIQDLGTAVPLRSRRGDDPFDDPSWRLLTKSFGQGRIAEMQPRQREAAISALRGFLRRNNVRWVVLVRSFSVPAADGRGFDRKTLDPETRRNFLENLRMLDPIREQEYGSSTLFELKSEPPR